MAIRLLLAACIALVPLVATAEQPAKYWGLSIGDAEVTDSNDNSADATNIGLHLGYHFTDWIGIELQAGDAVGGVSGNRRSEDTRYVGGFARFDLPFERTNLFVLLGGSAVELDEGPPANMESESGVSGGIGLELFGNERTAVRLEYVSHADQTYEMLSLGFTHHFDWPSFR